MKKTVLVILSAVLMLTSCVSTKVKGETAADRGIEAWNSQGPYAARAYWEEIEDVQEQKKYLGYLDLFTEGKEALDSTDDLKPSNESKFLSACNTAIAKFSKIDQALILPPDVAKKGGDLTAVRVEKLLAAGKISDAAKLQNQAETVYGTQDSLSASAQKIKLAKDIQGKRDALAAEADKISGMSDFDEKIAKIDSVLEKYNSENAAVERLLKSSEVGDSSAITPYVKSFRKVKQDIAVAREAAFRDKVYDYKNRIGEEFARQPEGPGSGKKGAYTNEDILAHYKSVQKNIDDIYAELISFSKTHNQDIDQTVLDDVKLQKDDLNSKIVQVNKEIANEKEIASRGSTVMPLMIGLFNADPNSSKDNKKSRPAKFSAKNVKNDEYWWGMVSIPKGQMNDLVITLKDNRTVRVFNKNTKSGKLIEKENLPDLVSRSSRVGNSWPVLNAGEQLKGSNYYFEVQKGKTDNYSGEVVVYSSFIVRMR